MDCFERVPPPILHSILSYVASTHEVASARLVCKSFHEASRRIRLESKYKCKGCGRVHREVVGRQFEENSEEWPMPGPDRPFACSKDVEVVVRCEYKAFLERIRDFILHGSPKKILFVHKREREREAIAKKMGIRGQRLSEEEILYPTGTRLMLVSSQDMLLGSRCRVADIVVIQDFATLRPNAPAWIYEAYCKAKFPILKGDSRTDDQIGLAIRLCEDDATLRALKFFHPRQYKNELTRQRIAARAVARPWYVH
jgi:hypothetical protein